MNRFFLVLRKHITQIISFLVISFFILSSTGCSAIYGKAPENTYISNFNFIWKEFDTLYSLFDVKNIDWNDLYTQLAPRANQARTDDEFFEVLKDLIRPLNDSHVSISTPTKFFNSGGYPWIGYIIKTKKIRSYI